MEKEKLNLYQKILRVQLELNAPKNQHNNFGNYSYRNLEDILEAIKPLLGEYGLAIFFDDEVVVVNEEETKIETFLNKRNETQYIFYGNRTYVKSTITVVDIETGEKHSTSAFAREDAYKKGMDVSQITGSASSYARKYAANAMFAIDDNKDADSMNNKKSETKKETVQKTRVVKNKNDENIQQQNKIKQLFALAKVKEQVNVMPEIIKSRYKKDNSSELTINEIDELLDYLKKM